MAARPPSRSRGPKEAPAARIRIKVVPGSSRDGIAGWLGEMLKVRVRAPAERGKANAAVEALVAAALGVPEGRVRIVAGWTSARKVASIEGLSESEVRRRLSSAVPGPGGAS